jgi:hypothetical protein
MQSVAKRCDPAPGRSGIRPSTSQVGANTTAALLFFGTCQPYRAVTHAARPCRRRNAAARSRPHCRQRHRSSLRSIRRLCSVSGCPLPQWLGISSRRILRRSILGKWTTAVLLVQSTPPLQRSAARKSQQTTPQAGPRFEPASPHARLRGLSRLVHRFESGRERHLINSLRESEEAELLRRAVFGRLHAYPLVHPAERPKVRNRDRCVQQHGRVNRPTALIGARVTDPTADLDPL